MNNKLAEANLTPAQEQVARLAVKGLTNRQIAETLGVSRRTVESHLSATYSKTFKPNRTSLIELFRDECM